jgi:DNA-binding NtrC family response regulator
MEVRAFGTSAARSVHGFEPIAWASSAMRSLEADVRSARTLDCNVLISGESGVGKNTLAHRLYGQSRRASRPLVIIRAPGLLNSDVLAHSLLKALPDKTILLEDPYPLPTPTQTRLLQFVERRTLRDEASEGLGETHDVRLLTITSCNLSELVRCGQFCESLFYRLNPIHLIIPPLRERPEDISVLLEYFFSTHASGSRPRFSAAAWQRIVSYAWPGNLRELGAVARALVSRDRPGLIEVDDLPPYMRVSGTGFKTAHTRQP